MTEDDVRALLHKATDKAGGVRAWARTHKLSAAYVSDVRLGRRSLGPAILDALGVEYVPITVARRDSGGNAADSGRRPRRDSHCSH